jgi:hypothetical protein
VVGLTDHGEHLTPGEWNEQAHFVSQYAQLGRTVLRGFEVTGTGEETKHPGFQHGWGHLLVFNSSDYAGTRLAGNGELTQFLGSYAEFHAWLRARPSALAIFAHPSLYMVEESFDGFAPPRTQQQITQVVACELSSHGPEYAGLGDGTTLRSSNEACYRALLRQGWQLGAIMTGDEHVPPYGDTTTIAGLYTQSFSETAVLEALRARRTFGTEEPSAHIRVVATTQSATALMGEQIAADDDTVIHAVCYGGSRSVKRFRIVCVATDPVHDRVIYSHELSEQTARFGTVLSREEVRSKSFRAVFVTARLSGGKDIISSPIFFTTLR